jgi:hypothetical protein
MQKESAQQQIKKYLRGIFFQSICVCALVFFVLVCASCSPELTVSAQSDGSTRVSFSSGFSKESAELLRSLIGTTGSMGGNSSAGTNEKSSLQSNSSSSNNGTLFTTGDISKTLASAGLVSVSASVPDSEHFSFSGICPAQSSAAFAKTDFFAQTAHSLIVTLGPKEIQNMYNACNEETRGYLDLLMAPVITGEKMSVDEYSELLASVYGPLFAKELVSGTAVIMICAPQNVAQTAAKNNDSSVKKITKKIQLGELLTLSSEKTWSVSW